jgi:hypothetical protein
MTVFQKIGQEHFFWKHILCNYISPELDPDPNLALNILDPDPGSGKKVRIRPDPGSGSPTLDVKATFSQTILVFSPGRRFHFLSVYARTTGKD